MKVILIIDINDDLLEDYENFYVDYDLRAERKDENVNESIKYIEDCPLKPMPEIKEVIKWNKQKYPRYVDWREYLKSLSSDEREESLRNEGYNKCIDEILGGTDD